MEEIVNALKVCKPLIDQAKLHSDYFVFGPDEDAALAKLAEVLKPNWQPEDLRNLEEQAGLQPNDINLALHFIGISTSMKESRRRGRKQQNRI